MKINRWWLIMMVVGVIGCPDPDPTPTPVSEPIDTLAMVCSKEWDWEARGITLPPLDNDSARTELSAPRGFQDIPEFHDCQAFVVDRGAVRFPTGRYTPGIFAIFAVGDSVAIDSMPPDRSTLYADAGGSSPAMALPAAQIFAETYYEPLQIRPGLNCVYLSAGSRGWAAWIRNDGDVDEGCHDPVPVSAVDEASHPLTVIREQSSRLSIDAYPIFARWVWHENRSGGEYRMGVPCDVGWCEVAPDRTEQAPSIPLAARLSYDQGSADQRRVHEIKGWHDEQFLAEMQGGNLVPSGIYGTIIPDTLLGAYTIDSFNGRWAHTADVALVPDSQFYSGTNPYQEKLNFSLTEMEGTLNRVSLCAGDWSDCREDSRPPPPLNCPERGDTIRWWVKFESADGEATDYRCVSSCPYDVQIPGTARWSWKPDDPILWMRCVNGCCEAGFH